MVRSERAWGIWLENNFSCADRVEIFNAPVEYRILADNGDGDGLGY